MRDDESNWFSRWEEDLSSPEELMPFSQTLITPDLALAFDIPNPSSNSNNPNPLPHHHLHHHPHPQSQSHPSPPPPPPPPPPSPLPHPSTSTPQPPDFADFENLGSAAAGEEPARTL